MDFWKAIATYGLILAVSLGISPQVMGDDWIVHVSTSGNDANDGGLESPVATIRRAQAIARLRRAERPGQGGIIELAPGLYALDQVLEFDARDSGHSMEHPVVYRAQQPGSVVISGGRQLPRWESVGGDSPLWRTRWQPEFGTLASRPRPHQLWVNAKRAVRARTPNHWDYQLLAGVAERPVLTEVPEGKTRSGKAAAVAERYQHSLWAYPGELDSLTGLSEDQLRGIDVVVLHKWDTTREPLRHVDLERQLMVTEGVLMKHWNPMAKDSLYFLENYRKAVDSPGEWFAENDGWLYYFPHPDEEIADSPGFVAGLSGLIRVGIGTRAASPVQHLRFDGLVFRHTEFRFPDEGLPPTQAAMNIEDAAILVDNARDLHWVDCRVEHVGATAVWFRHNVKNCSFSSSRLFDLGATGVRIGETQLVPEAVRTGHITVDNCIVHSGGRNMNSAVGLWIGHSSDNRISHCDIADFYYTAVSVGWRWGYAESGAKRNKIEYNHLHHIGYRILSDMGGVYTLGPSEGTEIRHNVIHDVYSTRYGGWGLYPDEGSTGILFENNLVYNVRDGGFHQHYGKENVVRNNIFAFSEEGQIAVTRSEPHESFSFQRNIVVWDQGRLLGYGGWKNGANVTMDRNIYWQVDGEPFDFAGETWSEWREKGRDQNSMAADPNFMDVRNRDFRFRDDRLARSVGFEPFDPTEAGVRGDQWRRVAQETSFPDPYQVPPSRILMVNDDFEEVGPTSLLSLATLSTEQRSELIKVVPRPEGGHCLRVQDVAELEKAYNPHLHWNPQLKEEPAELNFRIKIEPDAVVACEWRTGGASYKVGPSLRIAEEAVWVAGRQVARLPSGGWAEVSMRANPGNGSGRTWDLAVTVNNQTQVIRDLKTDPEWTSTNWLGFSSEGRRDTVWWLDDIKLVRP